MAVSAYPSSLPAPDVNVGEAADLPQPGRGKVYYNDHLHTHIT